MSIEAMKLAQDFIERTSSYLPTTFDTEGLAIHAALRQAIEQAQKQERRCCPHDHDCAVHNMPAYPAGACDCTYKDTHNLPPSSVVHEICLALLKREVDRRCEDNFGRMPNDSWTNKVLDVYHFFDSNKKAKKLTVIYDSPPPRQPLTDEQIWNFWWSRPEVPDGEDDSMEAEFVAAVRRVLAAHGITGEKE